MCYLYIFGLNATNKFYNSLILCHFKTATEIIFSYFDITFNLKIISCWNIERLNNTLFYFIKWNKTINIYNLLIFFQKRVIWESFELYNIKYYLFLILILCIKVIKVNLFLLKKLVLNSFIILFKISNIRTFKFIINRNLINGTRN